MAEPEIKFDKTLLSSCKPEIKLRNELDDHYQCSEDR